jgi:FlgD Ig-like domain/Bacterial pre-peptidase C-terminal domain
LSAHPPAAPHPAPAIPAFALQTFVLTTALALVAAPGTATADRGAERAAAQHTQLVTLKQLAVDLMRQGAERALAEAKLEASQAAKLEASQAAKLEASNDARGERDAPAIPDDAPLSRGATHATGRATLVTSPVTLDTRLNDPLGDSPDAAQSEPSVAACGRFALAAWNDGQGFVTGGDTQGSSWSADGGITWHVAGAPPHPSGWRLTSDPVLTADEQTGDFWYAALVLTDASTNGVAVAHARVSDTGVLWDPPVMAHAEPNVSAVVDKPWLARDPAGGALYAVYSCFRAGTDEIDLVRSTDGGHTWSTPLTLSSAADAGLVQGARVAVRPDGAVVVVWSAIGPDTDPDYLRVRISRDGGVTFGAETTPAAVIANFGTGAPGYNRERGVHYPSLAIDRGAGPHRGRVYLVWSESYDFYDDVFPDPSQAPAVVEREPNDSPGSATPFQPGAVLRGVTSSIVPADRDCWSVSLAAGEKLVVWADSLPPADTYTLRLFAPAPDTAQRLCYGGDVTPGAHVTSSFYTFVAPAAGTYTLRFSPAFAETTSHTGGYRIRTLDGVSGVERGRDQRDVFVTWSDDGMRWSAPVRVNDDPVGYDDYLPEVAVGPDGRPYVSWFDFRDDPSGSRTEQAIARSDDGGAHWSANARISSAVGDFTASAANLAPDMGDYAALVTSGDALWAAWADARGASVDVWGARLAAGITADGWPAEATVDAGAALPLALTLTEHSPLFGERGVPALTDTRGWPLAAVAPVELGAGGSATCPITLSVPVEAAGIDTLTLTIRDAAGEIRLTRSMVLTVPGVAPAAPGAVFELQRPSPTPFRTLARIEFRLPVPAGARLEVFGPGGGRVRTLAAGALEAGAHEAIWDGRDEGGRLVGAGVYFVRLESGGQTAVRRLVRL